jgi:hypothetical protein
MSLTLHCVNCHADIPSLNRLGRCTRCDSQAVLSVEREPVRDFSRGTVCLPDFPYLEFACKRDAERFVERIARSNKSKGGSMRRVSSLGVLILGLVFSLFSLFGASPVFGQAAQRTVRVTVLEDYINQAGDVVIIVQIDRSTDLIALGCDPKWIRDTCKRPLAGTTGEGGVLEDYASIYKGVNYLFFWDDKTGGIYYLTASLAGKR